MKLTQAVFTSIAIWVPAIYLLSSSPRTTAKAVTPSQTEWREVGVYRNAAGKTVQLKERLIKSEWDHLTNGKRVTFQINAIGRDFGAMEFDVICNATDPYVFERKIPIPDSGFRAFTDSAMPYFQIAKVKSAYRYCVPYGMKTRQSPQLLRHI